MFPLHLSIWERYRQWTFSIWVVGDGAVLMMIIIFPMNRWKCWHRTVPSWCPLLYHVSEGTVGFWKWSSFLSVWGGEIGRWFWVVATLVHVCVAMLPEWIVFPQCEGYWCIEIWHQWWLRWCWVEVELVWWIWCVGSGWYLWCRMVTLKQEVWGGS